MKRVGIDWKGTWASAREPDHQRPAEEPIASLTHSTIVDPVSVRIRRARADDATGIHAVHVASIMGIEGRHYSADQLEAWARGRSPEQYVKSMAKGEMMFVAEKRGRIVGFSTLDGCEIRAVFVLPELVGHGVGAKLLRAVEGAARRRGVDELTVFASLNGEAFYRRAGFHRIRQLALQLMNNAVLPAVQMHKPLMNH